MNNMLFNKSKIPIISNTSARLIDFKTKTTILKMVIKTSKVLEVGKKLEAALCRRKALLIVESTINKAGGAINTGGGDATATTNNKIQKESGTTVFQVSQEENNKET